MIAHFTTHANREPYNWLRASNSLLPPDIAVRWLVPMPSDFHARFKAIARRYRYVTLNQPYRPAILNGQVTHEYAKLDIAAMQQAVKSLVGTHNFTSFRASACQSNQPVRNVHFANLVTHGDLLVLDIQADGFLHHMVRNIMGCLLEIGQGMYGVDHIDHIFAAEDRKAAGVTAPPDGLYFIQAEYPEYFDLPKIPLGPYWLNMPE